MEAEWEPGGHSPVPGRKKGAGSAPGLRAPGPGGVWGLSRGDNVRSHGGAVPKYSPRAVRRRGGAGVRVDAWGRTGKPV